MIWQIAARNLFRNARRSLMTIFAIGISGTAILLFGGFVTSIWFGVQTSLVQDQGHLQIFKRGYLAYGSADPDSYTIDNVEDVIAAATADADIARKIATITPQIAFGGIAGNPADDNSKTFIGRAVRPDDVNRMRSWDSWNVGVVTDAVPLRQDDDRLAVLGVGMARMIGLCSELQLACEDPPVKMVEGEVDPDMLAFIQSGPAAAMQASSGSSEATFPRLDLLAATSGGAPNIVSVDVATALPQAVRAVDDSLVLLHYDLARQLLYRGDDRATSVMVQAHDPMAVDALKADLQGVLNERGLDLEVLAFNEVDPTFNRIYGMFSVIFGVIAIVLGIVIVFTITNTVTMNVMERINEVGTIRALGFRRFTVFRQFLTESLLLGLLGAGLAVVGGLAAAASINAIGLSWTPPSNATPIAIDLMVAQNPSLIIGTALGLTLITVLASILPATRAIRFPIVTALHHA
ncbi:ABC transporter permease [Marinivivus vitaminiproducens]|uniref:ABC transporter permease n=1 Tax=Marinivivus vitaminiproducens TaxID=3035935 RepID=UPI002799C3E5|nr:FtsX-like permease family protein [Geminicoccaceae bacterium SCSIO 64248]